MIKQKILIRIKKKEESFLFIFLLNRLGYLFIENTNFSIFILVIRKMLRLLS